MAVLFTGTTAVDIPVGSTITITGPGSGASPDGSTITPVSGGSLIDAAGNTWTFDGPGNIGTNTFILLNGGSVPGGGQAVQLKIANQGHLYALTSAGQWYVWNVIWVAVSAP